jgi:NAD(P)H-flavin reductase
MMKLVCATKPYTPISWDKKSMKLLIKLYLKSQTSNYFKQLKIDDEILIRGPYGDFQYNRNRYLSVTILILSYKMKR